MRDVGILCEQKKKKGHQGTPPQLMRNDCSLPTGNWATLANIFQSNKEGDARQWRVQGYFQQTYSGIATKQSNDCIKKKKKLLSATVSLAAFHRYIIVTQAFMSNCAGGDFSNCSLAQGECTRKSSLKCIQVLLFPKSAWSPPWNAYANMTLGNCANLPTHHEVSGLDTVGFS